MEKLELDAFISFSFKDQKVAELIYNTLINKYHIRAWICTRQLEGGTPFKDEIVRAIKASKVFVLLQSTNSLSSSQVPREVAIALDLGKTVIPFMIEESHLSELSGSLYYDLVLTQIIDATIPTLDDRIEELVSTIRNTVRRSNKEKGMLPEESENLPVLISSRLEEAVDFVGREREFSEIHQCMAESRRVFIQGIGGIGKSEIARQYAARHGDEYDTVVWATYETTLREMVTNDTDLVIQGFSKADGESTDEFYARKLKKLKELSTPKTLIIVDNFDVDFDPDLKNFLSGEYAVIITTRNDHSDSRIPTVLINEMTIEDQFALFRADFGSRELNEEDTAALEELRRYINGHTLTIKLIAKMMKKKRIRPGKLLVELKKVGVSSGLSGTVILDNQQDTVYGFIRHLFNLATLSEEEKQIMMNLSLMPADGIDTDIFLDLSGQDDGEALTGLIGKSWIIYEEEKDWVRLHPLICEVVRNELKSSAENCEVLIGRLAEAVSSDHYSYMDARSRLNYHECIKAVFASIPDMRGLKDYLIFPFFQFMLKFGESVWVGESARRLINSLPNEDKRLRACCEYYEGDSKINTGFYEEGIFMIEDAVSIYEQYVGEDYNLAYLLKYLFITKSKFQHNVSDEEILPLLKRSEQIFLHCTETESELNNGGREGFEGSLLFAFSMYEYNCGVYGQAIEYARKAIEVMKSSSNQECVFWMISPMTIIAFVDLKTGKADEAIQIVRETIRMSVEYFSEGHYVTWARYQNLCRVYDFLNKYSDEMEVLYHMKLILEKKNEQDTIRYQRLLDEIAAVEEKIKGESLQ